MAHSADLCPCIFGRSWASHEASCAAAGHDCQACPHCTTNIQYWADVEGTLEASKTLMVPARPGRKIGSSGQVLQGGGGGEMGGKEARKGDSELTRMDTGMRSG